MNYSNLLFNGSKKAEHTIILAHGAGAPMDTPFMTTFAGGLANKGFRTIRFEFSYMRQRRQTGVKKPPSQSSILQKEWETIIDNFGTDKLIIGGKSMGGRIASMIALEKEIAKKPLAGLICLGYPFHPPGKLDNLRISHLTTLMTPTLICQGERDIFGTREEVETYSLSDSIQFHWLEDGDHGFKPKKASNLTEQMNWDSAITAIENFVNGL